MDARAVSDQGGGNALLPITEFAPGGDGGEHADLALLGDGSPVLAYHDATGRGMVVLKRAGESDWQPHGGDPDPDAGSWVSLAAALDEHNLSFDRESEEFRELHAEVDSAYQRGLSLNPGYSRGYLWYGEHLHYGQWRHYETYAARVEANRDRVPQKVLEKGVEVDPLSVQLHNKLSEWGSPEESLWHAQRIVEADRDGLAVRL